MLHRVSFGKLKEVIAPPNFIEIQLQSFSDFLQKEVAPEKRRLIGLQAVFHEAFPIENYDGNCRLEYVAYRLGEARYTQDYCIREGLTYAIPLYVTLKVREGEDARQEEVYFGELPIMGERGSFVINGAERVIVSQLHRSPGICFEATTHTSGKVLYSFRIIPDHGTWLEVQFDSNDLMHVYLDRRHRRRKFLITTLLRAMGFGSDREVLGLFYKIEEKKVSALMRKSEVLGLLLVEDVVDAKEGIVLARAYESLSKTTLRAFEAAGVEKIEVFDASVDDGMIVRSLERDAVHNQEEALREIYKRLRPGEPVTLASATTLFQRLFNDPRRYDLGRVGRYKMNQRLGLAKDPENRTIDIVDLVAATKYLCGLRKGEGSLDIIDHLGNRRVRSIGELLVNQCRIGLARMEHVVREKLSLYEQTVDALSPQRLVNPRIFIGLLRDFFARSQLSQLLDQINPLSEIAHKRRLSALGPGGLNRDRAGLEARDVQLSHYGRICPIETPEGANIGLINSLSIYARLNEFGFIETPYREVHDGVVTNEITYLDALRDEHLMIAQAHSELDEENYLCGKVVVRQGDQILEVEPEVVSYMDISPKQVVSVATGLIPFLEHNDPARALMGSNMQRQGVPLLSPQAPFVGTGLEAKVARDSHQMVLSLSDGIVASADAKRIVVSPDGTLPKHFDPVKNISSRSKIHVYKLRKFVRSNATTCFNQHPIVTKGQAVKIGTVLADGAATEQGELALGRNVVVAFMLWDGYNFEDAVILNRRMVKEDWFTSIHIEEFECVARDTKLGAEEITRDIPNLGEETLKRLDRDGIVYVGLEVKPGDVLVGKITPKGETELAPEEKLLRAIFGEKASDVKDSSLIVPPGCYGVVMDVRISGYTDDERKEVSALSVQRHIKRVSEEFREQEDKLRNDLTEALSSILLGEKIPLDIRNSETQEVVIPANRKITKTLLRRLAACPECIDTEPSPVRNRIMEIIDAYCARFKELEQDRTRKIALVEAGNLGENGVIKSVKVFIATKRKIQVGDKMAGRHGNKGVVACVVKQEDMPFLPDGTPVDVILNPLGVPSRMNVGQIFETHLGWACQKLGISISTPIFDGASEADIREYLQKANLPPSGKVKLYDGRTGEPFEQEVTVGVLYMMKLNHLVANKIHARAVGPYSLVTQQPLGGKAQFGGQRFGEMEVWALEAYGAAYTLQELLTVKSDDIQGRTKIYESIVKGDNALQAGMPQSFNVLMKEIQSLCLDIRLENEEHFPAS
ncbi:MAG: DNA-directed RNA polymerase subunit beta [Puniceicoccales bacterium]|jgi:DNA-directed RNA polymerase subunit beta|nr:DNA-directed RNA polymerase subunit beta [Puniceicoccales bacterium]